MSRHDEDGGMRRDFFEKLVSFLGARGCYIRCTQPVHSLSEHAWRFIAASPDRAIMLVIVTHHTTFLEDSSGSRSSSLFEAFIAVTCRKVMRARS